MSELDEYREQLARMRLGDLVVELVNLKLEEEPEGAKERITQVQKQREVQLQINRREVVEDERAIESRDTKIRSLKHLI